MRALVWIVEDTWKATIAAASALVPGDAEVTLLYVTPTEAETLVRTARFGLLGRHHRPESESLHTMSEQSARNLLAEAQSLLGRQAALQVRDGRVGREVLAAAEHMDLLVLARDGDRARRGPHSLGPTARFVVDHAPCNIILIWPDA
jgi:nucleotide-binding universal stress UspA family protein